MTYEWGVNGLNPVSWDGKKVYSGDKLAAVSGSWLSGRYCISQQEAEYEGETRPSTLE
jgi:hypothetical protein